MLISNCEIRINNRSYGLYDSLSICHIPLGLRSNIFIRYLAYINNGARSIPVSSFEFNQDKALVKLTSPLNKKLILERIKESPKSEFQHLNLSCQYKEDFD